MGKRMQAGLPLKGKKLALNKNGKLYTNRWYKGYYLTANGTIAKVRWFQRMCM